MPDRLILGVSGSLRRGSFNTMLLRAAAREVPDGVALRILNGLREVPPYDEDLDGDPPPAAVAGLRARLAGADGLLVATPEYNHSIPGQLKNAIDWASRPFPDNALRFLPVAVIGASTGAFGAVWAQTEIRKTLAAAGARVVEGDLALGHAHERFDPDGNLLDAEAREQLREALAALVQAATGSTPISAIRPSTRRRMSSRIGRISSSALPAGSSSSQST